MNSIAEQAHVLLVDAAISPKAPPHRWPEKKSQNRTNKLLKVEIAQLGQLLIEKQTETH